MTINMWAHHTYKWTNIVEIRFHRLCHFFGSQTPYIMKSMFIGRRIPYQN